MDLFHFEGSVRIISGYYKGLRLCSFSADFIRPMTDRVKTSVFNVLYSECGGVDGKRVLDLFSGTGSLGLEALSRGAQEVYMVDSHKKSIQIIKKNLALLSKTSTHLKKWDSPSRKDHLSLKDHPSRKVCHSRASGNPDHLSLKDHPSRKVCHSRASGNPDHPSLLSSENLKQKSTLSTAPCLGNLKIYQKNVFRFLSSYKGSPFDLIFADPPFKKHYGERTLKALVSSKAKGKGTMIVLEISVQEKTPEETDFYHLKVKKHFGDKQTLFYS